VAVQVLGVTAGILLQTQLALEAALVAQLLVQQLVLPPLAMGNFLQSLRIIAMVKVVRLQMHLQFLMRLRLAILLTHEALVAVEPQGAVAAVDLVLFLVVAAVLPSI
jgi:hypothetical protein